jgi:dipeptidyl aminopeptidase/acylaminoacyl peptidase
MTGIWGRLSIFLTVLAASSTYGQVGLSSTKRPITVSDGIAMTRWAGNSSFFGGDSGRNVASFSPDGKRFILVLRRGNLEQNTNDFSLLLYQTADALHAPKPVVLLKMCSSSERDAIRQVRWLADNDTLVFLGENPGEAAQLYLFQIDNRTLKKLTDQPTAIIDYDITSNGRTIAFMAESPVPKIVDKEPGPFREIVIEGQDLFRIVAGGYSLPESKKVFWQMAGSPPQAVQLARGYSPGSAPILLSPDGRYVLFSARLANDRIPSEWAGYGDDMVRGILATRVFGSADSRLEQYLVFDSENSSTVLLINSPILRYAASWSENVTSIFLLSSYLPLDVADAAERKARSQTEYPVEVKLPSREYRKVAKEEVPAGQIQISPTEVALEQDLNTPAKLYATDPKTHKKVLLLDLNPQFEELQFGRVETIEWEVNGAKIIGGLYLPPDYRPGKRYPLVIQTHGFMPTEFSMDGRSEWSSGFAARPLAARGVLVLQAQNFKDSKKDYDRIGNDRSLGATRYESFKNFSALVYGGAIDFLDKKGVVDRGRVGIVGFSRTVCFVGYTLTHSKYRFAAASIIDGIECGYLEEMTFPAGAWDFDALNGGAAPFGEGLKLWMKNSPGFNLDKVKTPIQFVALGNASVSQLWEWYVGLSLEKKPVDFVLIPEGNHLYGKPAECMLKQQGLVDWFAFWLKDEEDPNPGKTEQYARWQKLRTASIALSSVQTR